MSVQTHLSSCYVCVQWEGWAGTCSCPQFEVFTFEKVFSPIVGQNVEITVEILLYL